ncbi:MAG: hypothetical protein GY778_06045 [bacterium]|nr:hypothetical protein [bacterium]
MAVDKFDVRRFFESPLAVAAVAAADELFGFLSRSLTLPPGVVAVTTRRQGDYRLWPAGSEVDGDDVTEVFFVRTLPNDLSWTEERIFSADKFEARATVAVRVTPMADRGELLSFRREILGSKRTVEIDSLMRHLQAAAGKTIKRLAEQQAIESLVDGDDSRAVAEAVAEGLSGPCFSAGMTIEDQPQITFESATYRQVRQAEQQAAKREREHAACRELEVALETAQRDHLDHLEGLLGKLRTLADDSPDVDLPELVRTFRESERGEVYEALFAASTQQRTTQWIVVAAGSELLFFDPTSGDGPVRTVPLGGEVGPLRSVQSARQPDGSSVLLIGAAKGVYLLPVRTDAAPTVYAIGDANDVRGGVNSVALAGEHVLASHSEIGLLCWKRDDPGEPTKLLENLTRDARAVRNVVFHEGRIYCSVDQTVLAIDADQPTEGNVRVHAGSDALITAVCPTADGLYAGNAEGQVLYWPTSGDSAAAQPQRIHNGNRRPAESVHLLCCGGVTRLFFSDTSPAIHARVIGDTFACRYEAGGQTLRRVEVAGDIIVATNEIRDRLVLWTTAQPASPTGTITIARQTGHTVQDVCLLPTS